MVKHFSCLRRQGRKVKYIHEIHRYKPATARQLVSPFGGALSYELAYQHEYDFVYYGDQDKNIENLYTLMLQPEGKQRIVDYFELMPVTNQTWAIFDRLEQTPTGNDPAYKAAKFLWISTFAFMGSDNTRTTKIGGENAKDKTLVLIDITAKKLAAGNVHGLWGNDYKGFYKQLSLNKFRGELIWHYFDPPYIGTRGSYRDSENKLVKQSKENLRELILFQKEFCKKNDWDYSPMLIHEFRNAETEEVAEEFGLNIYDLVAERECMRAGNKQQEIVMTNYIPDFLAKKPVKMDLFSMAL